MESQDPVQAEGKKGEHEHTAMFDMLATYALGAAVVGVFIAVIVGIVTIVANVSFLRSALQYFSRTSPLTGWLSTEVVMCGWNQHG